MHIVQVTPRFPPALGGMENYVYFVSRELVTRGHQVSVVTSDDTDSNGRENITFSTDQSGIRVLRYPLWFKEGLREYWCLPAVKNALSCLKPDIVHAHGYRCLSSWSAARWCRNHEVPLILTAHGIYPPRSIINGIIKKTYDRSFGNLLLKYAKEIIALTPNNRDLLLKTGASSKQIVMIPNGVDVTKFRKTTLLGDSGSEELSEERTVLYVGRVDWNKGLENVIEAMALLRKQSRLVKLLIVGPDYAGYTNCLRRLADRLDVTSSIIITGSVSDQRLMSYYSHATIFILPSLYEGLSTSLLEAMAAGVPVIATRFGGSGDVLTDGADSLLLKHGTPEEISDAIKRLLRDVKLRCRICENAFKLVSEKYDWHVLVDEIEGLYMRVSTRNQNQFQEALHCSKRSQ